jgi:hypothetical protein
MTDDMLSDLWSGESDSTDSSSNVKKNERHLDQVVFKIFYLSLYMVYEGIRRHERRDVDVLDS